MSLDKHTSEEDFPLSGGSEPDFEIPRWGLFLIVAFIVVIAALVAYAKYF